MRMYIAFLLLILPFNFATAGQKIFGIGLSHTGTRSLTAALRHLGFKIAHYPMNQEIQEDLMYANWDLRMLKHVDGITDLTVAPYYVQLHQTFPDAKFILTVRKKAAWLAGCEKHWKRFPLKQKNQNDAYNEFRSFLRSSVYGILCFNKDRYSYVYDKHTKDVLDYFADFPDSLLVLNVCEGDGWEPLCRFLQQPIPNIPFPHVSSK